MPSAGNFQPDLSLISAWDRGAPHLWKAGFPQTETQKSEATVENVSLNSHFRKRTDTSSLSPRGARPAALIGVKCSQPIYFWYSIKEANSSSEKMTYLDSHFSEQNPPPLRVGPPNKSYARAIIPKLALLTAKKTTQPRLANQISIQGQCWACTTHIEAHAMLSSLLLLPALAELNLA